MKKINLIFAVILSISILYTTTNAFVFSVSEKVLLAAASEKFIKTELYFGMSKPDGGEVSEADWEKFVDEDITKHFPEGFAVLSGSGQYRDRTNNRISKEKSKVLVLIYSEKVKKDKNKLIEELRHIYKEKFKQQSVLRIDSKVEVGF